MKLILIPTLFLAACATVDDGSKPVEILTLPAAIAAEKVVQQRCPRNVLDYLALLNGRALVDSRLAMSEADRAALRAIRDETDAICPAIPVFTVEPA